MNHRRIKSAQVEIRCFNLITDPNDPNHLYGLECGRLLLKKNLDGQAAGQIRCPRCKTLYEITGNQIIKLNKEVEPCLTESEQKPKPGGEKKPPGELASPARN